MRQHVHAPRVDHAQFGLFSAQKDNTCAACGRSHWHVGRFTAECSFCGNTLAVSGSAGSPSRIMGRNGRGPWLVG